MLSAVLAMVMANSALASYYEASLHAKVAVTLNGEGLAKPLILWINELLAPLPLEIAAGLVVGKQVGVLGLTWMIVQAKLAQLPHGVNWRHIYGVACLAGVGFTMSLFIGGLSFADPNLMNQVRIRVLGGSVASGVLGFVVLRYLANVSQRQQDVA